MTRSLDPGTAMAEAVALWGRGESVAAAWLASQVVALDSGHYEARQLLGAIAVRRGAFADALANFEALVAAHPASPGAWTNHGRVLAGLGRHAEALDSLGRALDLDPAFADAAIERGRALLALGHPAAALASLDAALAQRPRQPSAQLGRGAALIALERYPEALAAIDAAAECGALDADAWASRGAALYHLQRLPEAMAAFDQALALDPANGSALNNRGNVLVDWKRFEEAARNSEKLVALHPEFPTGLGELYHNLMRCADWRYEAPLRARVVGAIERAPRCVAPFTAMCAVDSPRHHGLIARAWAPEAAVRLRPARPPRARLCVGYVSSDFRDHPVGHQIAGLFAHHDRRAIEACAVSLTRDDGSEPRRRIAATAEHFVELAGLSDDALRAALADLGLDVVVDLNGLTEGGRLEVFARGVAPLQIQYLGYAGTTGSTAFDYVIGDEFVIPAADRLHYSEQVISLADTFFVTDGAQPPLNPARRDAHGLPASAVVLCAFHGVVKVNPAIFDVWMRILHAVERAVLWLASVPGVAQRNLRAAAAARGIAADRLVFATFAADRRAHLSRLALADLFLDTLPYGAHSTAADALWAGVPVLTCAGRSFPARVAGSLLRAARLAELVADDLVAYQRDAIALAQDPVALAALRARIAACRRDSPLFDTARFCRQLEHAYATAWQRHRAGEPSQSFTVPAP